MDRLPPRLTREQILRAWFLVRGQKQPDEPQYAALYDPTSGFVLGARERLALREEMVKATLRHNYSEDVLNHALNLSPEADEGNVTFDHSGAASTAGSCVTCHTGAPTVANNIITNLPSGVETAYQPLLGDVRVSETPAAASLRQNLQSDAPNGEVSRALLAAINKEA